MTSHSITAASNPTPVSRPLAHGKKPKGKAGQAALSDKNTAKVVEEAFLTLQGDYLRIELPSRILNKKCIHLYPSPSLIREFEAFGEKKLDDPAIIKYLETKFLKQELQISRDTTLYYPDKEINARVVSLKKDNLYDINNSPLQDKKYLYIIDKLGRLIIDEKRFTPAGRIQHSSLSQGQPVRAAGELVVKTEAALNRRVFFFSNYSGHYAPIPESLNHVEQLCFLANYKKEKDDSELDDEKKTEMRFLTFSTSL